MQRIKQQEEEKRNTMQFETEMKKRQAEYAVQLELQKDREMLAQKE